MRHNNYIIIFIAFLLMAGTAACTKEIEVLSGKEHDNRSDITIRIAAERTSARTTNPQIENKIETIDLLVFKKDEADREIFDYSVEGRTINDDPGSGNFSKKTFEATLKKDPGNQYRLVIIANAHEAVTAAQNKEGNKNDVLKRLRFANNDRWPHTDSDFRSIPMWGESILTPIDENTVENLATNPITLYMALARVDVRLDADVDNFTLNGVYVYNRNTRGCVAPDTAAISSMAPHPYNGELRFLKPSVPPDSGRIVDPIYYPLPDPAEKQLNGAIYILETTGAKTDNATNATCLVIAGEYNGNPESYYRIDFRIIWHFINGRPYYEYNPSQGPPGSETVWDEGGGGGFVGAGQTFPHILRNHIYEVTIGKVTTTGKDNPGKAFNPPSANSTERNVRNRGTIRHGKFEDNGMEISISGNTFEPCTAVIVKDK